MEAISAATAGAGVTITLSGQTEAFSITGSGNADTIAGGTGADTIAAGGGADIISVGASDDNVRDAVRFTAATDYGDTVSNFDVTGTSAQVDVVQFTGALNMLFDDVTNDDSFAFALATASTTTMWLLTSIPSKRFISVAQITKA